MAQEQIDTGASANDGLGDPLRTAFIKTDNNFDQIWNAGPVGSNITILNNTIAVGDTNGNIILQPNGVGVVQTNASIIPNINNGRDLGAANLRWRYAYIQNANLAAITVTGDTTINGNLIVKGDTIEMGNIVTDSKTIQLANTAASSNQADGAGITVGANDDIATLLYDSGNNTWTTNIGINVGGPITGTSLAVSTATIYGNLNGVDGYFTGNVTANYFIGDGSLLTNINANAINGLATVAYTGDYDDLINTPDFGNLTSNITTTGNITGNYFIGDGSLLTGITSYANANAVAYGEAGWAGNIIPSANNYYTLGNSTNQWESLYVSNTTIYINNVPISMTTGNVLTIAGEPILSNDSNTSITTTGNITANIITATESANLGSFNFYAATMSMADDLWNNINISPNVEGWAFLQIPKDAVANIDNVRLYNSAGNIELGSGDFSNDGPSYSWYFDKTGNVVLPSEGNIVGTTPNNAGRIQWLGNSSGDGAGYTTLGLIPDDTLVGNDQYLIIDPTAPGHIHIRAGGQQDNSAAELIMGGEYSHFKVGSGANATAYISANSHIWWFNQDGTVQLPPSNYGYAQFYTGGGANLYLGSSSYPINIVGTDGSVESPGNVTAAYFIGDGSQLTGLPAQYGNSNVATFLAAYGSNTISTSGNVTAGNFVGSGTNVDIIAGSYDWTFDNAGTLTLPGNTFAVNYANGTAVSLGGNYGNSNVATFLASYGSNTISTTGNITAGNLIGNISITGNVTGTSANVDIIAGSYQWTFNNTGNLVLPGNTFTVNYANGTAVTLGGSYGNANVVANLAALGSNPVSTTGNITAGYFIGNGSQLTGLPASYTDANVSTFLAAFGANSISTTGNVTATNFIGNVSLTGNIQGTSSNVELVAGVYTWTFNNAGNLVLPGNTFSVNYANGTAVTLGGAGSYGNANVADFLDSLGSNAIITTGNVTAGNLITSGAATTGVNALLAGPTFTPLANTSAGFVANVNSYSQITFQNKNTGADATADYILTADNGSDTVNYGDFGIINSGYDVNTPTNSLGNIVRAGDTYVYAQGNVSNTSQSGGNLIIGTTTATKNVKIFAGGANNNALIANISNTGVAITGALSTTGNITANNITGSAANVTITANAYVTTFDTTGLVTFPGAVQLAVYANTTARDAAIPSPAPGMMIYVTGTGMQMRGATQWNTIAGSGT